MNLTVATYLIYLAITVPLTVWVARTLHRHGNVFLVDVFRGDERLASSVNNLLVTGFYLLNLGYVAFFMRSAEVTTQVEMMETLARKVGAVSLALGGVHLANVWAFNTFRKRAVREAAGLPPVHPDAFLPPVPR